jgi:hypothetical protein
VAVEHGWWFPERSDPQHGGFESNINVVIPDNVYDPIYGCSAIKAIPCRSIKPRFLWDRKIGKLYDKCLFLPSAAESDFAQLILCNL